MTLRAKGMIAVAALAGCLLQPTGLHAMTGTPQFTVSTEMQSVIELSRQKWLWMADRNTTELEVLFHPSARFVHMGATLDCKSELDVVRSGQIQYKHADISETSAERIGDTVIVYSRLRLTAVVGGNEVVNPFAVTEVYMRQGDSWKLGSMAFTRLLGE